MPKFNISDDISQKKFPIPSQVYKEGSKYFVDIWGKS